MSAAQGREYRCVSLAELARLGMAEALPYRPASAVEVPRLAFGAAGLARPDVRETPTQGAGGATVRRSTLEAAGWGLGEAVTPNALDVAIHRLKRKLVAINSDLQILNARGYGYALRPTSLET